MNFYHFDFLREDSLLLLASRVERGMTGKIDGVSKKNSICLANPEEFNLKWCLELFPIMSREEDRSEAAGEMFMTSSTKDIKTNFLNSISEKFLAMLL